MSLETRVETLEHELKILKNEIESTLLEIQNQVLVHYYPSLRAAESAPPKDLLPFVEVSVAAKGDEAPAKESADERSLRNATYPLPKTKEISLQELQGKSPKMPTLSTEQPTRRKREPASATVLDQAHLPHLARWVSDSVEKIGKELTQNMVESSASAEYTTPEIIELLLQFITLSKEENPPEQVDTKELMDALLKLNKVLDYVAKGTETAMPIKEENGQSDHDHLHDHR